MLKGVGKINKYLTDWCKSNGFKVKCRIGSDFEYDRIHNIVYYSFVISDDHDKLFKSLCSQYLSNDIQECDTFILSFFHELGHYLSKDDYDEDEWDKYFKLKERLTNKKRCTDKDFIKYIMHPIELEATIRGCEYLNSHIDNVEIFAGNLSKLTTEFFKLNNIEDLTN